MPMLVGAVLLAPFGLAAFTFTVAGATIALSTVVGTLAISGALLAYTLLTKPSLPKPDDGAVPLRQAIPPRTGAYGIVRVSGDYMCYEIANGVSHDILAQVDGSVGATLAYYLHDDLVTITAGGVVNVGADGRYGGGNVMIKTRDGASVETPFSEVVAALPSVWTNDHRGDGISQLYLQCKSVKQADFSKFFPNGLPQPSRVIRGYPTFDPRMAGQSHANPATWAENSTNPVLQLMDYWTHPRHGLGHSYNETIAPRIAEWIVEANLCDNLVPRVGGNEKRYQSSGQYKFDNDPAEVINAILSTMDGWMVECGDGTVRLRVGYYRAPTVTLTTHHVIGYDIPYGSEDENIINEVTISFTSPAHKYREVSTLSWRDEANIAEVGKTRSHRMALTWVTSNSQARRLAKLTVQRLCPILRGTIVTTLFGIAALEERWIRIQDPRVPGLEDAVVEVQRIEVDVIGSGQVTIDWIKIDPTTIYAWNPAVEEGAPPVVPDALVVQPLSAPSFLGAQLTGNSLVMGFADLGRPDLLVRAQWRLQAGPGPWNQTPDLVPFVSGPGQQAVTVGVVPTGTTIEVQLAAVAPDGSASDWSATLVVVT